MEPDSGTPWSSLGPGGRNPLTGVIDEAAQRICTIYPGAYPTRGERPHIHFTGTVGGKPKWRTLWFEGGPILTAEKRQRRHVGLVRGNLVLNLCSVLYGAREPIGSIASSAILSP